MNAGRSALLRQLTAEISTEQRARYTRTGFLGPPPELYWEHPTCRPFINPDVVNTDLYVFPARIIPGLPQDAEENAAAALCSAILGAEDYEAVIQRIFTALGNQLIVGSRLDPGAFADLLHETQVEMTRRGMVDGEPKRISEVKEAFRESIAIGAMDLCLDQWEEAYIGRANVDALRNVSILYGRLRCWGFVPDEDFHDAVEMILDDCTHGNLELLFVAVVDLISPSTMSSIRRAIPKAHWVMAQQQLNEMEGRAHEARGRVIEEEIVELLCGMSPTGGSDDEEPPACFKTEIEDESSDPPYRDDPDFAVFMDAIHYLRSFLTELRDADEAPTQDPHSVCLPYVEYCTDPPPLATRKWRYLYALCKGIQKWAVCPDGISPEITWRPNMEDLRWEADHEVLDPDAEIYEEGVDFNQWTKYHRACDVIGARYGREAEVVVEIQIESEEGTEGVHKSTGNNCRHRFGMKRLTENFRIGPVPCRRRRPRSKQ